MEWEAEVARLTAALADLREQMAHEHAMAKAIHQQHMDRAVALDEANAALAEARKERDAATGLLWKAGDWHACRMTGEKCFDQSCAVHDCKLARNR